MPRRERRNGSTESCATGRQRGDAALDKSESLGFESVTTVLPVAESVGRLGGEDASEAGDSGNSRVIVNHVGLLSMAWVRP